MKVKICSLQFSVPNPRETCIHHLVSSERNQDSPKTTPNQKELEKKQFRTLSILGSDFQMTKSMSAMIFLFVIWDQTSNRPHLVVASHL